MGFDKRYSVVCKGLADGAHEFSFGVGDAFFASCDNEELRGGDCRVTLRLRKAGNTMVFATEITGTVITACDRCLDDCPVPVKFEGTLTVRVSDETAEYDGETMWISPADDEIEFGQYIYESIVLSLPYRRVHAEGECNPEMMSRFTVATAEEFDRMEEEVERRQMHGIGSRDMEKLAALRARMEQSGGDEQTKS